MQIGIISIKALKAVHNGSGKYIINAGLQCYYIIFPNQNIINLSMHCSCTHALNAKTINKDFPINNSIKIN